MCEIKEEILKIISPDMTTIMPKIIIIIIQLELCVLYLTQYLRSRINETSLTVCQHIQIAMQGFSTAELMCSLGNTVTEECPLK
jgi:hypothetical protein